MYNIAHVHLEREYLKRDLGRFAKIKTWRPYASSGASFNFAVISIRD
jgi:hypothetical protein